MPDYTVWLANASFVPDAQGQSTRGDFVFLLLINDQPQAQLELTVEAPSSAPTSLIGQAQQALAAALRGWQASLSS